MKLCGKAISNSACPTSVCCLFCVENFKLKPSTTTGSWNSRTKYEKFRDSVPRAMYAFTLFFPSEFLENSPMGHAVAVNSTTCGKTE